MRPVYSTSHRQRKAEELTPESAPLVEWDFVSQTLRYAIDDQTALHPKNLRMMSLSIPKFRRIDQRGSSDARKRPIWHSVDEVAKLLERSTRQVLRLIDAKALKAHKRISSGKRKGLSVPTRSGCTNPPRADGSSALSRIFRQSTAMESEPGLFSASEHWMKWSRSRHALL